MVCTVLTGPLLTSLLLTGPATAGGSMAAAEFVAAGIPAASELRVQRRVVLGPLRGARQRVEELHRLRLLVRGDVAPAVLDELASGHCRGLVEHDDGLDVLQEALAGDADDRGLLHRRVGFQAGVSRARAVCAL